MSIPRANFECFQPLDEEGYNERRFAIGRIARSTVFVSGMLSGGAPTAAISNTAR